MNIKIHGKKPTGIPRAGILVTSGRSSLGSPEVTLFITAFDALDAGTLVASLRLSPNEARHLATSLKEWADRREATNEA